MLHQIDGRPLAEQIPPVDVIVAALERIEGEAALLRKLVRLAHARDREAARLARLREAEGNAHAH